MGKIISCKRIDLQPKIEIQILEDGVYEVWFKIYSTILNHFSYSLNVQG